MKPTRRTKWCTYRSQADSDFTLRCIAYAYSFAGPGDRWSLSDCVEDLELP